MENPKFKFKFPRLPKILFIVLIFLLGGLFGFFVRIHVVSSKAMKFEKLSQPLYQAWGIVHDQYLEHTVDDTKLMQGAIKGMMDSLGDPYTAYMNPEEYQQANTPLVGEYTASVHTWTHPAMLWSSSAPCPVLRPKRPVSNQAIRSSR
jgi:hypothetical protein